MKSALLAFATALRLAPARGFVGLSPGPIQRRCKTAKYTFLPPTRRRERFVAPPTALALASGAEAGSAADAIRREIIH